MGSSPPRYATPFSSCHPLPAIALGSLALRLPIRADASRETVASDGREIRYSPRWVAEAQAHVIETAMARVVLACALKHHTRRGQRDPERWQRASQLVTHGLLRDAGFTLPPDAEAWDGISVEQAYARVGPQAPPTRGPPPAARRARRPARGSLPWTTRTSCHRDRGTILRRRAGT